MPNDVIASSWSCAGAGFSLPVGYVTLLENIAMAAMGVASILS